MFSFDQQSYEKPSVLCGFLALYFSFFSFCAVCGLQMHNVYSYILLSSHSRYACRHKIQTLPWIWIFVIFDPKKLGIL